MIKRTILPNLATKSYKSTSLSCHSRIYDSSPSQIHHHHSNHTNPPNSSSLNHIDLKNKFHLKTQQPVHSQMNTLEINPIDPSVFHTKVTKHKSYEQPYTAGEFQQQSKKIAPYFFKIHCGLKLLQNQQELKKKMLQAQIQQHKLKTQSLFKDSKKKIQKKITDSSMQKLQHSIDISQPTARYTTIATNQTQSKKKFTTEPSQLQYTQSLLEDSKQQLADNKQQLADSKQKLAIRAKEGKYTFEHFNSGQFFESIAELNQQKLLLNPNQNQYRTTAYGTYVNNFSGIKPLHKKTVQNGIYQQFKQQYNSFLKNKLPPSFGQNGNKSCIYEEYVEKRKIQSLNSIQSKVVTRPQPQKSHKAISIFSNDIKVICGSKAEAEKMYECAVRSQEEEVIKKTIVGFLKQSSTETSRMMSEMNSKMNTLRHGQSLQDKLKLKKLAKLKFIQKAKTIKKHVLKSIEQKHHQIPSKRQSSLSSYSSKSINKVSQQELQRLRQKSELILGKEFQLSNPVLNPQQHHKRSKEAKLVDDSFLQLNQYQARHLKNVDALLKKEVSLLRKHKQDLDSTPWKIPIKIDKKPSFAVSL